MASRINKNNDNLTSLNSDIDFTNKKIAKFVNLLEGFKKENDRTYNSDDWFQWSEGRVTLGKKKVKNIEMGPLSRNSRIC